MEHRRRDRSRVFSTKKSSASHSPASTPRRIKRRVFPEQALRYAAVNGRSEQEGWRVRKDGARFWANTVVSALLDEHKNLVGFSVVTRDLTERKRVEEILRESEAKLRRQAQELEQQLIASGRLVSLGVITASMAHEFNNPLGHRHGLYAAIVERVRAQHAESTRR